MPKMLWSCDFCGEIFRGSDAWERCRDHELHGCKELHDKNAQDRDRLLGLVRAVLQAELSGALRSELDKAQKRVFRKVKRGQPAAHSEMLSPLRKAKPHELPNRSQLSVSGRRDRPLSIEQEAMLRGSPQPAVH